MSILNKMGEQFSGIIEPSPLEYPAGGKVRRISLIDTSFPEYADIRPISGTMTDPETGEERDRHVKSTYFDTTEKKVTRGVTGKKLKNPRIEVTPGATRGTAAFLDYTDYGNDLIDIHYMKTHPHYADQGLARQALEVLYQQNPNARINWGKLMQKQTEHLYEDFQSRYPEQTGSAKYGWA